MNFLFPYMARWKAINWTRYHQIFTRLAETGHNVYVLQPPSMNLKETNFQEIEIDVPENLHLMEMKLNSAIWNKRFPLNKLVKKGYYAIASKGKVKDLIKEYNIDAIMLYNIPQYPLLDGNACLTIFDFADDYMDMLKYELGAMGNPYILRYAYSILEKMIDRSDLTLTVSNVLAESMRRAGKKNIEVLPNGASPRDFVLKDNVKMKGVYKKPVIGFIGAFEYFINFDLMLTIAEKLPQITFLMVGGGRDFEGVRNRAEIDGLKNVIFTGPVPHPDIPYYINEMDICLNIFKDMPVSHGTCPLKLFEYLLMKKPVISNRLKEVELIDKNFIFYADKTEEFVSIINQILKNPELGSEYAERGYETTMKEYTWEKITDRLVGLIESSCSKIKTKVL